MKEIVLTKGYVTIVDDEDYDRLSQWKWYASSPGTGNNYAARRRSASRNVPGKTIFIHREITNAPDGVQVDHINGDGLDNRRCNLRLCTQAENNRNVGKNRKNSSGHKGVRWIAANRKWAAVIKVDGKRIWLGGYDNIEDAVTAYAEASRKYHKEFGRIE